MSSQNMISASLPDEVKTSVLNSLAQAKDKLNFLLALRTEDIQSIYKPGSGYLPFIDLVDHVVEQHPEILSTTIDIDELRKDIALAKQLAPIIVAIDAFSESLHRTYTAVCSDAMGTCFDVYSLCKLNRDKVPGMSAIVDEMASYFKKSPRKTANAAQETPPTK
jgi:hypothetical protein